MKYNEFIYGQQAYSPPEGSYGTFLYGEGAYHSEPIIYYGVMLDVNSKSKFIGRIAYGGHPLYGPLPIIRFALFNNNLTIIP